MNIIYYYHNTRRCIIDILLPIIIYFCANVLYYIFSWIIDNKSDVVQSVMIGNIAV